MLYSLAKDGLFFCTFQELDQKTHVPTKGAWVSCVAICLLSVFLDVEELTFIISVENLFTFSITNCGLIALRYRDKPEERHPNEIWAWVFMLVAFVFSISWGYRWHPYVIIALALLVCAVIAKLHRIP